VTRDDARAALEAGKYLNFRAWTWGQYHRSCHSEDNCCYESFDKIEDVLDDVGSYAVRWDDVEVIE
jgi:hypothetical protein